MIIFVLSPINKIKDNYNSSNHVKNIGIIIY